MSQLEQPAGSFLGIVLEGGIDTKLQYVFIKELEKGSPAAANGRLRPGDQVIMLGDECLVGTDAQSAQDLAVVANSKTKVRSCLSPIGLGR